MGITLTHAVVFCYFWTCGHDEEGGGISHRLIWDATNGHQTGSLHLQQGWPQQGRRLGSRWLIWAATFGGFGCGIMVIKKDTERKNYLKLKMCCREPLFVLV